MGSNYDIFAQRYNPGGEKIGEPFRVNTFTDFDQRSPCAASLPDDGFVICRQGRELDGMDWGDFAQRFDATGSLSGGEFQVNTQTRQDQHYPVVTSLDNGFVIAWQGLGQDGYEDGTTERFLKLR